MESYIQKVKGAWYGQMIGATLGEPFSLRWQNQKIPFEINNYLKICPEAVKKMNRALKRTGGRNWTNLQHKFIDDIKNWEDYQPQSIPNNSALFLELMYLHSFETHPMDSLKGRQFAEDWLEYLKYEYVLLYQRF